MKASVTELPFNSFLGIQISTEPSQLLRLPSGQRYLNHLGTVHASAQLALAEASSGEFLLRHFGSTNGIVPVVRRLEAKFRKPANGVVTSIASATPESLARLDAEQSVGHYFDFWSAVLGLTLFPLGYLYHALTKRQAQLSCLKLRLHPYSKQDK